jgi:hypothetical protein
MLDPGIAAFQRKNSSLTVMATTYISIASVFIFYFLEIGTPDG